MGGGKGDRMSEDLSVLRKPFDDAFRWLLLFIVLWSFTALAATGQLPPGLPVLAYILFVAAWIGEKRFPLPRALWRAIIAAFLLFDIWIFMAVGRIDALVYMLIFLQINKLWSPKKSRDVMQILLISFFFVLSVAVMTTRMSFLPIFIVFLFLLVVGLIFLTVRREHDALSALGLDKQAGIDPKQIVPASFYARAAGAVLLMLAIAAGIFMLFPRFSKNNFLSPLSGFGNSVSGFGTEIELGRTARIDLNPAAVMWVSAFEKGKEGQKPMESLYLRGNTVETYYRGLWREHSLAHPLSKTRERQIAISDRRDTPPGLRRRIVQNIFIDPGAGLTLFTMDRARLLLFNMLPPPVIQIDANALSFSLAGPRTEVISYRVESDVLAEGYPDPATWEIEKPERLEASRIHYLELPPSPRAEIVAALAHRIVEEAAAQTPYEKTLAVRNYLQTQFSYSLDNLDFGGACPTETFLLDERRGHCEYFASGMAVLLRRLDIPCRIVNGYYTNEWNPFGKHFVVRQSDAHSWVEVFFNGAGWLPFDPSPPAGLDFVHSQAASRTRFGAWLDALRLKWYFYVVDYNLDDQRNLADALSRNQPDWMAATFGFARRLSRTYTTELWRYEIAGAAKSAAVAAVAAILTFIALGIGGFALSRARGRGRGAQAFAQWRRVRLYERILKTLRRRGLERPRGQTPREFAQRVEDLRPALAGFRALTERYYQARSFLKRCRRPSQ